MRRRWGVRRKQTQANSVTDPAKPLKTPDPRGREQRAAAPDHGGFVIKCQRERKREFKETTRPTEFPTGALTGFR